MRHNILAAFIAFVLAMFIFGIIHAMANVTPLMVAQSQIGNGEEWGNNKGKYVRMYLQGRENLPWCAGFVSYCFKKAGYDIKYTLRAKDFLTKGSRTNDPKPGDVIVFTRVGGGHVGIVEKVSKSTITTIEGNIGEYPSKVKRITYRKGNIKNFLAYVRVK